MKDGTKQKLHTHVISLGHAIYPLPYALQIRREIKKRVSQVLRIRGVEVRVQKRIMADEISKTLREM
jgi:hypothetical protein